MVTLDGTKLEPSAKAKGTLTITDTATGKARTVSIAANVTTVLEFLPPNSDTARQFWNFQFLPDKGRVVYNVRPGAAAAQQAIVLNRSAAQIAWKAAASASWVRVEPAEGKVAPESPLTLTITATPPDAGHAIHNETVTLTEADGPAGVPLPLAVHVIPAYQKPALPAGQPFALDEALNKSLLKTASGASGNAGGIGFGELKGTKDKRLQDQPFTRCFRGGVPYEAVFKIADQGFTGFSAHVGLAEMISGVVGLSLSPAPPSTRVYLRNLRGRATAGAERRAFAQGRLPPAERGEALRGQGAAAGRQAGLAAGRAADGALA